MSTLLLVEDHDEQRDLYSSVLVDAGYEVIQARSGKEALESFERLKPDIVVLDIQMPGIDGIEALGRLLAKDKHIPVILHSAYPSYKANFMTWAADAFVEKTGETSELVKAVNRLCAERGIPVAIMA